MHALIPDDAQALAVLPEAPTREQIEAFGHFLQSLEPDHGTVDLRTAHVHAHQLYGRGVVIEAGTFLVGLAHKADSICMCVGDATIWSEGRRQRYTGAHILPSAAGAMRIGYAHRDTAWFSVHVNDTGSTDLAAIEQALVEHPERLLDRRATVPAPGALQ